MHVVVMNIVVVMGISGSGKTTIGQGLANVLGWPFYEGDSLHPRANVEKMSRGFPLTDADRQPWLQAIRRLMDEHIARGQSAVITCSALKQAYRDFLVNGLTSGQVTFVYLKASFKLLRERVARRKGHYMPVDLLA
ncbi:MAG: gluconokinase, partial [Cellvibrionaceae bacterium]